MRAIIGFLIVLGGCSAASYERSADTEGWAVADEKMAAVERFRSNLVDPRDNPDREPVVPPIEVPAVVTLSDAIRIATRHNRDYKTQREAFFLAALGLTATRHDFNDTIFSGSIEWDGDDGERRRLSETTALAFAGTKLLRTGGTLTVSGAGTFGTSDLGSGRVQDATASGTISISQPLLRGRGYAVAFEGLTQAERDVVYAARTFEQFRQQFAVDLVNEYLRLVSQKIRLGNTATNVKRQELAQREANARFAVQEGSQQDVLRAEANYRDAVNRLLDAQQSFDLALDRFKITLGLPVDVQFDVGDEKPPEITFDTNVKAAVAAALANRLDLRTTRDRVADAERDVKIARNDLLPDLSLDASYTSSVSGNHFGELGNDDDIATLGLRLDFPFERKSERNAYRSALISLERARRDLRDDEDRVILDIRDVLRRLRQQQAQIENDEKSVEIADKRVRRAEIDLAAGAGSNRDLVEQIDAQTDARNRLIDRRVSYYVTRLDLLQRLGLLFVDKEGRIIE